ncbi:MAG: hypothetical protein ACRC8U_06825 [Brooklawnia sp.]
MTKPTLFIGIDGPALIHGQDPEPLLRAEIAPYVKPFVHWARQHFDVRWVTDRSPRDAFHLNEKLGLPADAIPAHVFDVSKVEVLEPHAKAYWIDAELIPHEVTWLAQHGHADRFLVVDPEKGITPEHKDKLEALTRKR